MAVKLGKVMPHSVSRSTPVLYFSMVELTDSGGLCLFFGW